MPAVNLGAIAALAVVIAVLVFVLLRAGATQPSQISTVRDQEVLHVLPNSPLGWWTVVLTIVLFAFLGSISLLEAVFGIYPFDSEASPALSIVFRTLHAAIPWAIIVTGMISILQRHERSILLYICIALGVWFGISGTAHLFIE